MTLGMEKFGIFAVQQENEQLTVELNKTN